MYGIETTCIVGWVYGIEAIVGWVYGIKAIVGWVYGIEPIVCMELRLL